MFKEVCDLAGFPEELLWIVYVLVLAAAAFLEELALWGDAVWGWLGDIDELCLGAVFFIVGDAGAYGFSGDGEGDENDPSGEFLVW